MHMRRFLKDAKEREVSIIAWMVTPDGTKHCFSMEEFHALMLWAEEIINEEDWELNEENLEKAILKICNENQPSDEDGVG